MITRTTLLAKPRLDIAIPTATFTTAFRPQDIDLDNDDDDGDDHAAASSTSSSSSSCTGLGARLEDYHHTSLSPRSLTSPLRNSFDRQLDYALQRPALRGDPSVQLDDIRYADRDIVSIALPTLIPTRPSPRQTRRFSLTRYHSISESIREEEDMAESVVIETAPNSPPELSYSKSSKSSSSSLRSSSIEDCDDDSANDSPHFEELLLDDLGRGSLDTHVIEDNNLRPESRPTLKRPQPRTTSSLFRNMPHSSPHMDRQSSPNGTQGVLQDQSTNLPTGRMMRRGFLSRSTSEADTYTPQRKPSDPSVYQAGSIPPSPQSIASITPRASQDGDSTFPLHSRRASWQATRKTVKQLEAEVNDDDEDVPEEAILENVPISPMPGMLYSESRTPSPRRPPLSPSYNNLHSAKVPKNARRPSAPPTSRSPRSPHLRRPHTLQHSNTVGAFPPEMSAYARKQRSKSWNDDLSDEARQLSAALEEHAEKMSSYSAEQQKSTRSSASSSPRRPSGISRKTSMPNIITLPPVQKGSVMIDPLPVSKEKEAVLTRTRPSWLPPKSQKEEKKHLKEWQQMMARAADAEKKRTAKEQEAVEQREGMHIGMESVWQYDILANWETAKNEPRTMELCWQGIAPASRGAVWTRAIGNELGLSATSFQAALNRARTVEERLDGLPAEELSRSKEAAWFSAIERDVPSVFPTLDRFAPGTPANQALTDVLKAYAMYRSDVGYVYGTHLVAGLLCLNSRPADAFVILANMLNRPIPLAFLIHDPSAMAKAHGLVLEALKRKHLKLHAHLTSPALDLMPEEYLDPLFRCLFAYNLTAGEVSRIWDVYAFEGDQLLVHAAVAVLSLLEPKLYGSKKEIVEVVGWRNQRYWNFGEDALVQAIMDVKS